MFHINKDLTYKKIGNVIYVILDEEQDVLYEFEGEAYEIMNIILYGKCSTIPELMKELSFKYIIDSNDKYTVEKFLQSIIDEKILIEI